MTTTEEFWLTYDRYITDGEASLRPILSRLLRQIETSDRREQLFRPEFGWTKIIAWQVLRKQEFWWFPSPSSAHSFDLYEGEILVWHPQWDRDKFITRFPYKEFVSGQILRPGYKLGSFDEEKENMTKEAYDKYCKISGYTDETGLYLPIYELKTLRKFIDQQCKKFKDQLDVEYKEVLERM